MRNLFIKIISCLLTLLMFLTVCESSLSVLAEEIRESAAEGISEEDSEETSKDDRNVLSDESDEGIPYIVGEDPSIREENAKYFRQSDGSYIASVYQEPVHFQNGEGEWIDIDNSLVEDGAGYTNRANDFKVTFDTDPSGNRLYTLVQGDGSISVYAQTGIRGAEKEVTVLPAAEKKYTDVSLLKTAGEIKDDMKSQDPYVTDEEISDAIVRQNEINEKQRTERMTPGNLTSAVLFSGIVPSVDLRYDIESKKIKESIIINEVAEEYTYRFFIETSLEATFSSDGEIIFSDLTGEPVFIMPSPFMFDNSGETNYEVEYDLEKAGNGYYLSVDASAEWINDPDRAFPVVIDPTVVSAKTNGSDWNIITQYISSLDTATLHSGEYYWKTGAEQVQSNSFAKYYSFIKVQYLPFIPYNCKYVGAYLYMPHLSFSSVGISSYNLIVKEALSDWRSEFSQNATNSNPIIDYLSLSSSNAGEYVSMNVTNAVRNWYDGNDNNGLVFTSQKTNGYTMTSNYCACSLFRGYINNQSGDYSTPFLAVEFRNNVGLEDYYSYETLGVDSAGTMYISDFTGNMTLVKNDVSGEGYTLSHIYNTKYCDRYYSTDVVFNTVDYSNMKIGLGWKLNAQQSVVSKTITGADSYGNETSIEYLIYSDADGTEHYFHKDTSNQNKFYDEDGLGYTITRSGNTMTMTDDKNNQKIFVYGYLSRMIDRNGNQTVFLYDALTYSSGSSAWLPKSSTDGGYNKLRRIVYVPDGQSAIIVATLYYDSGNRLTSVKDRNSDTVSTYALGNTGQINAITMPGETTNRTVSYLYGGGNLRMDTIYDGESKYGVDLTYSQTDNQTDNHMTGIVTQYRDFTSPTVNGTRTYYHNYYVNVGTRLTKVRDCGINMATGGGDDILTSYVFDNMGKTVTSYTLDGNNNIVGVAGGKYQENSGTSKKNNRLISAVYSGAVGHNLLWNSGLESGSTSYFNTSATNATGFSVTADSSIKHTGSYSLKLSNGNYGGYSMASQPVTLPKTGRYTFSAYVKIGSITVPSGYSNPYGARLSVKKNDETVAESEYIKTQSGMSSDGWVRLYCTFEGTVNDAVYPCVIFTGANGTVYVDDLQFENNGFASEYNLLSETYIRSSTPHSWNNSNSASFVSSTKYDQSSGYVIKLNGAPSKQSYISQDVNVQLLANETYMLSGWAKAASVAPRSSSTFQITATLHYTDNTDGYFIARFSTDVVDTWQYAARPVIPQKDVASITVTCSYKANANTAYFDEISLHREIAQAYTYNGDGKLVTVNQTKTDELQNEYQGVDLIRETGGAFGEFDYTYDSDHNLTKAENGNLDLDLTYDAVGNVTVSRLQGTGNAYMQTTATYTDKKTKTASVTDSLGNTTNYTYNVSKNQLTGTTVPVSSSDPDNSGTVTATNTYYDSGRTNLSYIYGVVSLSNTYLNGNLSSITRGGYYDSSTKQNQTYNFTYDVYGQLIGTSVGNVTLSTNTYDSRERLVSTVYGNGDQVTYSYDNLDRISAVTHNDSGDTEEYFYDGNSNISKIVETGNTVTTHNFEYDTLGRLIRQRETSQGDLVGQVEYSYDLKNRLKKYEFFDGKDYVPVEYTYRAADGALTE